MVAPDFPNVVYLSLEDGAAGRTKVVSSAQQVIQFSDGSGGDYLPVHFTEADYMINISVVKHHSSAGFSNNTKNHFGSNMRNTAQHMHSSLVENQQGYNHYRHFVDLMAHKELGGKTILNIGDMLWSSANAWSSPVKFQQTPFNDDYPSSLLLSVDPVAIESVALDFISTETWNDNLATTAGVDDFLIQAADPLQRPPGIAYDPEGDGTIVDYSLGIYEHWNNPQEKLYSKNLGTGNGIELVRVFLNGYTPAPYAPVKFNATFSGEERSVMLAWTDINTDEDGFNIEKSIDGGETYLDLITTGENVTSYSDSDVAGKGIYYYRIKSFRGVTSSSYVGTNVRFDATPDGHSARTEDIFSLYPVPASDRLNIRFNRSYPGPYIIRIFDMNGKLLLNSQPENLQEGASCPLDISYLQNGLYILAVNAERAELARTTFIIHH